MLFAANGNQMLSPRYHYLSKYVKVGAGVALLDELAA